MTTPEPGSLPGEKLLVVRKYGQQEGRYMFMMMMALVLIMKRCFFLVGINGKVRKWCVKPELK